MTDPDSPSSTTLPIIPEPAAAAPPKIELFGKTVGELIGTMTSWGWPKFRARQVADWVYQKGVVDPAGMTNLSKETRAQLAERIAFDSAVTTTEQHSNDGTIKLLLTWANGSNAETVMIPDGPRHTACVSSQVGCPVGCRFCASGVNGVKGNLTAAQIVEQVFQLQKRLPKNKGERERISNVVFMGMGEPLANYANVMHAVRILHDPDGFNIGARKITISTVGVPSKMKQLAGEELPLNLAISLHAPNEPLRRELIPWAEHFPITEILDAARYYFDRTGREITLEYILLSGVNDRPEHAAQLVKICRTLRANVNLIRYNEVESLPFIRPKSEDVMDFQEILQGAGVNAHVRKSRGRDIDAACGQLRRKQEQLGWSGKTVRWIERLLPRPVLRERAGVRVNSHASDVQSPQHETLVNEAQPTLQITLTPTLSRSTGRGGQRGNGFTTIELLVAVFVLGVIATILVPYVMKLREVDRRNRCAFNLNLIRDALHRYAADNKFQYPRVIYDGKNEPNTYTCFSGPDAADPFAAGGAVKPNDVTASIWLLLRDGNLTDPAIFICPSSEDHRESITDPAGRPVKITQRSNFRSGDGLSYGYSTPFSAAIGYKMNDTRRSDFAILGDKAPPLANAGALSGPGSQSPPLQFELLNSRNHAGAGQNVLFADDSVLFERTPYCGVGRSQTTAGDNIYTALAAKPLKGETPPADGIGFWGHDIGPAWESDSYLVPREGESAR